MRGVLTVAIAWYLLPADAWAGAWTVPRHRWYTEYFARYFGSKKTFDTTGDSSRRIKTAIFRDIRNEFKAEYGLTDWLNLLASVPYQSSHYRDDNVDLLTTGVGDMFARTKLRLTEQPLVTSLQWSWKIPSAYDPNESPALGDGQFDFESRLQLSRSFTFWPREVRVARPRPSPRPARAPTPQSSAPFARRAARPDAVRRALELAMPARTSDTSVTSFLYQLAQEYRQEGRLEDAAHELSKLLLLDPSHAAATADLAAMESSMRSARAYAMDAALASARTPAGAPSAEGPNRSASAPQAAPEAFDVETRYDGVSFFNIEGGFTARNEDPANEVPLFLEVGFTPAKRLMLVGSYESVTSIKSTHEQEEDVSKVGLRAILNVWGRGFASVFKGGGPTVNVEIGYNDIVAGRNTADAFELFSKIGVFF